MAVCGITDYFSFDGYFEFLAHFREMYPSSDKVFFPNLELRLESVVNGAHQLVEAPLLFLWVRFGGAAQGAGPLLQVSRVAPAHCCARGPLRTVRAGFPRTRLKQAAGASQGGWLCSCVVGRGAPRWQEACTRRVRSRPDCRVARVVRGARGGRAGWPSG